MKPTEFGLCNREIQENYSNRVYYLFKGDFLGALAYWIIRQSPCDTPNITLALEEFNKYLNQYFKEEKRKTIPVKFSFQQIEKIVTPDVFEKITAISDFNKPMLDERGDFIDLSALSRNVFYMICREYLIG